MAGTSTSRPDRPATGGTGGTDGKSIGELISLAVRDVSQLVKWEIDLAKLELRDDVKRLAISGGMLCIAAFVACLVLVLLSFAAAYGLMAAGIWAWAAFLIVSAGYVLLAGGAVVFGVLKIRGLTGLRRTRASVQGGLALLHRDSGGERAS
jgi:uncharacterized membrane protein YqjE